MRTEETVGALRAALAAARGEGPGPVGLVPTMGALHAGHAALLRAARAECAWVVASLFVNPAQFSPTEDLAAYPRDADGDARTFAREGVDVLFVPDAAEVYPPGFDTAVHVGGLASVLEGDPARRGPGHFRGVGTVVVKLLNMAAPEVVYLGQKDLQQALVVRRLVRDLDLPVAVRVVPTVRDAGGLALSSRNAYLGPTERDRALALSRGLRAARERVSAGELEAGALAAAVRAELERDAVEPEYVELRRIPDLTPAARAEDGTALLLAARVGRARLIDNVVFGPLDVLSDPLPVPHEEVLS